MAHLLPAAGVDPTLLEQDHVGAEVADHTNDACRPTLPRPEATPDVPRHDAHRRVDELTVGSLCRSQPTNVVSGAVGRFVGCVDELGEGLGQGLVFA